MINKPKATRHQNGTTVTSIVWFIQRMDRDGSNLQIVLVLDVSSVPLFTITQSTERPIIYLLIDNNLISYDTATKQMNNNTLPDLQLDILNEPFFAYNNDIYCTTNSEGYDGWSLVSINLETNNITTLVVLNNSEINYELGYFAIYHSIYYALSNIDTDIVAIRKLEGTGNS
jgi:hypothetical protein